MTASEIQAQINEVKYDDILHYLRIGRAGVVFVAMPGHDLIEVASEIVDDGITSRRFNEMIDEGVIRLIMKNDTLREPSATLPQGHFHPQQWMYAYFSPPAYIIQPVNIGW